MPKPQFCWTCRKEWVNLTPRTSWCPQCGHALDRPPLQCDCPLCVPAPPPTPDTGRDDTPMPYMPIGVDPVRWIKHVGEMLRMIPDDAAGMLTLHNAVCVGLQKLAEVAVSDSDHVTRNVRALELMADLAEQLMHVAEVG